MYTILLQIEFCVLIGLFVTHDHLLCREWWIIKDADISCVIIFFEKFSEKKVLSFTLRLHIPVSNKRPLWHLCFVYMYEAAGSCRSQRKKINITFERCPPRQSPATVNPNVQLLNLKSHHWNRIYKKDFFICCLIPPLSDRIYVNVSEAVSPSFFQLKIEASWT